MNTKKVFGYGLIPVMFVVAFSALSLTGCKQSVSPSPVTLIDIMAVYTGAAVIYPDTPLDSLKADLIVTAIYNNKRKTLNEEDYTLSGILTVGDSIVITVSYKNESTTFTITVTALPDLPATITISPNSDVETGMELTATYSGSETVSYQWKKDETNVGTDSNKYTPTEAGSFTVTVSAAGYNPKTSAPVIVAAPAEPPSGLVEMVWVPGGSFQMGDTVGNGFSDELPVHTVTLTGFYMGKYEVTQAQYEAVMGTNPCNDPDMNYGVGDNYPVYNVSWYDAIEFCNELSAMERLQPVYTISGTTVTANWNRNGYRLPTEAQWEYAAKGGDGSPGNYTYSGSDTIDDVAWYWDNSVSTTHAVGTKSPNGLGIYDMSGNVCEWCWDWYEDYSSSTQTDPTGPIGTSESDRVRRGGNFFSPPEFVRSAIRYYDNPSDGGFYHGFRLVRQ